MNKTITMRFDRARHFLDRIREDLKKGDPKQGMVDAAELGYQAGALYGEFRKIVEQRNLTDMAGENSQA